MIRLRLWHTLQRWFSNAAPSAAAGGMVAVFVGDWVWVGWAAGGWVWVGWAAGDWVSVGWTAGGWVTVAWMAGGCVSVAFTAGGWVAVAWAFELQAVNPTARVKKKTVNKNRVLLRILIILHINVRSLKAFHTDWADTVLRDRCNAFQKYVAPV